MIDQGYESRIIVPYFEYYYKLKIVLARICPEKPSGMAYFAIV